MLGIYFVTGSYGATGEGITTSMLVTRAHPHVDDYDANGNLLKSREEIALREFREIFGDFFGRMGGVVTQEEFYIIAGKWLPEPVKKTIEANDCNVRWFSQVHLNFS